MRCAAGGGRRLPRRRPRRPEPSRVSGRAQACGGPSPPLSSPQLRSARHPRRPGRLKAAGRRGIRCSILVEARHGSEGQEWAPMVRRARLLDTDSS
eukprot:153595-Chlamydomonas_euryale.AAC.6